MGNNVSLFRESNARKIGVVKADMIGRVACAFAFNDTDFSKRVGQDRHTLNWVRDLAPATSAFGLSSVWNVGEDANTHLEENFGSIIFCGAGKARPVNFFSTRAS